MAKTFGIPTNQNTTNVSLKQLRNVIKATESRLKWLEVPVTWGFSSKECVDHFTQTVFMRQRLATSVTNLTLSIEETQISIEELNAALAQAGFQQKNSAITQINIS